MSLAAHAIDDPVTAALACASVVPMTDEERELLAEFDRDHTHWVSSAEIVRTLESRRPSR